MGNCLKTQLKGNVNNNDLVPIGSILIKIKGLKSDNRLLSIRTLSEEISITSIGGRYISSVNGEELTNPTDNIVIPAYSSDVTIYGVNGEYNLLINGRYKENHTINFYCDAIINIEDFVWTSRRIVFGIQNITVNGDFAKMGKLAGDLVVYANGSTLSGKVEDFVKVASDSGYPSGRIIAYIYNTDITFGILSGITALAINWESVNRIYCTSSEDLASSTLIYTSGYTPEEIVANQTGTGELNWVNKVIIDAVTGTEYPPVNA